MTDEYNNEILEIICEECKKENESVKQNLILTGYKICDSCKISKNICRMPTKSKNKFSINAHNDFN